MPTFVAITGTKKFRVDAWDPEGGAEQWGLLLEPIPENAKKKDWATILTAFRGDKPMYVLSTRFKEPSFSAARRTKEAIEAGRFSGLPAGPTFNPNSDNVNFEGHDQEERDDRWLQVLSLIHI